MDLAAIINPAVKLETNRLVPTLLIGKYVIFELYI